MKQTLQQGDQLLSMLRSNMIQAQNCMKLYVDQHRTETTFNVGDWVYLRIQPYIQTSLAFIGNHKLSSKFYGPYQVEARIGQHPKFIRAFMCLCSLLRGSLKYHMQNFLFLSMLFFMLFSLFSILRLDTYHPSTPELALQLWSRCFISLPSSPKALSHH